MVIRVSPNAQGLIAKSFLKKFEPILGKESKTFFESLTWFLPKTIRVNTLKASEQSIVRFLQNSNSKFEKIEFLDHAFFVSSNFEVISKSLEHELGLIQIMSASAMIPVIALDPKVNETVLDLTAAPGNKTIMLAQFMGNQGLLIANESDEVRLKRMRIHLLKNGVTNCLLTHQDGIQFDVGLKFDKILLDAPCSSDGEINKTINQLKDWSQEKVIKFQELQKQLMVHAFDLLKPGGELVYSTCTFSPEENEDIVQFLLDSKKDAHTVSIKLKGLKGTLPLEQYNGKRYSFEVRNCLRIWPYKHNLEGFFVGKIKKSE